MDPGLIPDRRGPATGAAALSIAQTRYDPKADTWSSFYSIAARSLVERPNLILWSLGPQTEPRSAPSEFEPLEALPWRAARIRRAPASRSSFASNAHSDALTRATA
jgi:hypothetical protein